MIFLIHTAHFISHISDIKLNNSFSNVDSIIESINAQKSTTGISFSATMTPFELKLTLFVDFILLLNKSDIQDNDYPIAKKRIDNFASLFNLSFIDFTLVRIDYRFDYKTSKVNRELYLEAFSKALDKSYHKTKKMYGNEIIYYPNELSIAPSSIYFKNKSISLLIYDKELERANKACQIEDYEKDILRFEVALYNTHLNKQKQQYHHFKSLRSYMNNIKMQKYLSTHFEKSIYTGDLTSTDNSFKLIRKSNLTELWKEKCIQYTKTIKFHDIDYLKRNISAYNFRTYKTKMNSITLNPLTFSGSSTLLLPHPLKIFFT